MSNLIEENKSSDNEDPLLSNNDDDVYTGEGNLTSFTKKKDSINERIFVDLKNYKVGTHEVEVTVTGSDLKLAYSSKTKKVKIVISEKK